jgi:CO/xanthine dehydrogenase Mo-binding subunit
MAKPTLSGGQIGRSLPRLEGRDKVTGRAEYTHLMQLPGMLHAKIFRSTVAHGRIKSVDTSAARKVPGVYAVYTSDDVLNVIAEPYYGPAFHDQPILAIGRRAARRTPREPPRTPHTCRQRRNRSPAHQFRHASARAAWMPR